MKEREKETSGHTQNVYFGTFDIMTQLNSSHTGIALLYINLCPRVYVCVCEVFSSLLPIRHRDDCSFR